MQLTNNELLDKLKQAQDLLSDVYHFACEIDNAELMGQMSCADSCIIDAFDILLEEYESDGQPDEAQEWESFDPDC